jgi:hypothetical protein
MTTTEAIQKLNEISPYWFSDFRKSLEIDSDGDIETVYDIMVDYASNYVNGNLTEEEIEEIDKYYKVWYGYSIREEE